MHYTHTAQGSSLSCKILGTYEKELHPILNEIETLNPSLVIDIGAAEGYYAVGLAINGGAHRNVVCFEMEESGRRLLQQNANWNSVSNLSIHGKCEVQDLARELSEKGKGSNTLLICDVEGYEKVLLDPQAVPQLRHAYMLVELHDHLIPGITSTLNERFEESHEIAIISSKTRGIEDFPVQSTFVQLFPKAVLLRSMEEGRGVPMNWMWLKPLAQ